MRPGSRRATESNLGELGDSMKASDVMTQPAVTLQADTSLGEAIGLMLDRGISGLPVVDANNGLIGMLTEGDLLRRVEVGTSDHHRSGWWKFLYGAGMSADEYVQTHSRQVGDLMTRDPATVTEATPLEDVVGLMEQRRVKRLPVLRDNAVVGIVSRSDLLRAIGATLGAPAKTAVDDAEVLGRLRAELDRQPWFSARDLSISVKDGVVALKGSVPDKHMHAALLVAARNASRAGDVRDEVEVIPLDTGLTTGL